MPAAPACSTSVQGSASVTGRWGSPQPEGRNGPRRPRAALHLSAPRQPNCTLHTAGRLKTLPAANQHPQGLIVFDIDGEQWSLDLREGSGSLAKGLPADKADLTLTVTDANFAQLVMGKLNPQQVSGNA